MIQRNFERKCCPQMQLRLSFVASTRLAVFEEEKKLTWTLRTQSQLISMVVEAICFGAVSLLRGQDDCTGSREREMGPSTEKF